MSARETIKEAYERLHRMEIDEIVDYAYDLEQENKELKELCDKYEEEHGTTFKIWLKTIDKLKKIEEYLTSYESISTIQGLNDTKENKNLDKNTMVEMTNRYLKVHDKILSIVKENKYESKRTI